MYLWIIGVGLSLGGCTLSNIGVSLQKKSHMVLAEKGDQDGSYIKSPWWIAGMTCVIMGSLCDLVSYGFAAMTLLAPLGAMTLVVNLFFAPCFLKEKLTRRDIFCTITILFGTIFSIVFGSKESKTYSVHELTSAYLRLPFIFFGAFFLLYMTFSGITLLKLNKKERTDGQTLTPGETRLRSILYPSDAGAWGAMSVLFAKSVAEVVKGAIHGVSHFDNPFVYIAFIAMFGSLITQTKMLNGGLAYADALLIVPVYQTFWVIMNVFAGMVYFQDYKNLETGQLMAFLFGVVVTVIGVYFLSKRTAKDQLIDDEVEVEVADNTPNAALIKAESGEDIQVPGRSQARVPIPAPLPPTHLGLASADEELHAAYTRIEKPGTTTTTASSATPVVFSPPTGPQSRSSAMLLKSESRTPLTLDSSALLSNNASASAAASLVNIPTPGADLKIIVMDTTTSTATATAAAASRAPVPASSSIKVTPPPINLMLAPLTESSPENNFSPAPTFTSALSPGILPHPATTTTSSSNYLPPYVPPSSAPATLMTVSGSTTPEMSGRGSSFRVSALSPDMAARTSTCTTRTPRPTQVRRPTLMSFFAPTLLDITPLATPSARPSSSSRAGSIVSPKRSIKNPAASGSQSMLSPTRAGPSRSITLANDLPSTLRSPKQESKERASLRGGEPSSKVRTPGLESLAEAEVHLVIPSSVHDSAGEIKEKTKRASVGKTAIVPSSTKKDIVPPSEKKRGEKQQEKKKDAETDSLIVKGGAKEKELVKIEDHVLVAATGPTEHSGGLTHASSATLTSSADSAAPLCPETSTPDSRADGKSEERPLPSISRADSSDDKEEEEKE